MVNMSQLTSQTIQGMTLESAIKVLEPLLVFMAGIVIYSIFIFRFYRFVAEEDVFELDLSKYNVARHPAVEKSLALIFYVTKYIFLFPLFLFFWFIVFSGLLIFLSKSTDVQNILLFSMALIGSIRVCAYYDEDLSRDLAKMLPFALLGVFLIDLEFFNLEQSLELLQQLPGMIDIVLPYFIFLVLLEILLRIVRFVTHAVKPDWNTDEILEE